MADQEEKKYSAKQVATRVGTDAKQLRKFFRDNKSGYTPVGQGGRYDFPESELPKIKATFDAWSATKTTRNRSSNAQRKLAEGAGIVAPKLPAQRSKAPKVDPKLGLHGNAMDDDDLHTRMQGIKARTERHGLVKNQQGRLVPRAISDLTSIDRNKIPGLVKNDEG